VTYYVVPVELADRVARTHRARRLNPDALSGSACFHIALGTSRSDAVSEIHSQTGPGIIKSYGIEVDTGSRTRHKRRWGALASEEKLIRGFRARGAYVLNKPRPRKNSVYVVKLSAEAGQTKEAKKQDATRDPDKLCLYVGQTGLSHQARFEVHKRGGKQSSKWVFSYGVGLIGSLNPEPALMTELDALRAEGRVAHLLRKQGYTVFGGTSTGNRRRAGPRSAPSGGASKGKLRVGSSNGSNTHCNGSGRHRGRALRSDRRARLACDWCGDRREHASSFAGRGLELPSPRRRSPYLPRVLARRRRIRHPHPTRRVRRSGTPSAATPLTASMTPASSRGWGCGCRGR
jgi:hypothetical protein